MTRILVDKSFGNDRVKYLAWSKSPLGIFQTQTCIKDGGPSLKRNSRNILFSNNGKHKLAMAFEVFDFFFVTADKMSTFFLITMFLFLTLGLANRVPTSFFFVLRVSGKSFGRQMLPTFFCRLIHLCTSDPYNIDLIL